MKQLLAQLVEQRSLSADQAEEAFEQIMSGQATEAQTASMLSLMQCRGPTVEEITGAATVMRRKVTPVGVPDGLTVIDTCGTGGDHASTFNISTAAALVAAAAGRPEGVAVAKHGNRSVTSSSGSSQVLETLGVKLQVSGETLSRCLDEAGLCFCFAPAHHPAMKHAVPVRGQLGFRTIFNVLGPLTNPAAARRQVIGVFSADLTEPIAQVLQHLGAERAMVVCGRFGDGAIDELTTTGPTVVSHVRNGRLETEQIDATALGLPLADPTSLAVDSPNASAGLIRAVLDGEAGPPRDIVALNAAAALVVADVAEDLPNGLERAADAIDGGAASAALGRLVELTQSDPTPQE